MPIPVVRDSGSDSWVSQIFWFRFQWFLILIPGFPNNMIPIPVVHDSNSDSRVSQISWFAFRFRFQCNIVLIPIPTYQALIPIPIPESFTTLPCWRNSTKEIDKNTNWEPYRSSQSYESLKKCWRRVHTLVYAMALALDISAIAFCVGRTPTSSL